MEEYLLDIFREQLKKRNDVIKEMQISDETAKLIQELIDMHKCLIIYLEIFGIQQNKKADNISLKINDLINNMNNGY